jgi:hypothetical protein
VSLWHYGGHRTSIEFLLELDSPNASINSGEQFGWLDRAGTGRG